MGLLKQQDFMKDFDYYDVDYCKYGMEYRKRTRIWTNLKDWMPRPLCKKDCGNIINNRHKETAQRPPSKGRWYEQKKHTQDELYRIPSDLINHIFRHISLM